MFKARKTLRLNFNNIESVTKKFAQLDVNSFIFPFCESFEGTSAIFIDKVNNYDLNIFFELNYSELECLPVSSVNKIINKSVKLVIFFKEIPDFFCENANLLLSHHLIEKFVWELDQKAISDESRLNKALIQLPSIFWEMIEIFPDNWDETSPDLPTALDIAYFIKKLKMKVKNFVVQRTTHFEWSKCALSLDYEIVFSSQVLNSDIKISCVIPSYNNQKFLTIMLSWLLRQSLKKEFYEVIVIDDGSSDATVDCVKALLGSQNFNFKLIYCHRKDSEKTYRAGKMRNLGAAHALGEKLVFLDSDIIVNQDFLELTCGLLSQHDVVQFPRFHIKPDFSNENFKISDSDKKTYIENASYWNNFFKCNDWKSLPNYWKYTCTYALALKKSFFEKVGCFDLNYTSYGFEDTELGYCLFKSSATFYMENSPVYHLTPINNHLQYGQSKFRRSFLLSKSAQVFYLNHLDEKIFNTFLFLILYPFSFYIFFCKLKERLKALLLHKPLKSKLQSKEI